jgi:hypothetical protein
VRFTSVPVVYDFEGEMSETRSSLSVSFPHRIRNRSHRPRGSRLLPNVHKTPRLAVPEWDEVKRLNLRCTASDFADADLVFDDSPAPAGSGDSEPPDYTPRSCWSGMW